MSRRARSNWENEEEKGKTSQTDGGKWSKIGLQSKSSKQNGGNVNIHSSFKYGPSTTEDGREETKGGFKYGRRRKGFIKNKRSKEDDDDGGNGDIKPNGKKEIFQERNFRMQKRKDFEFMKKTETMLFQKADEIIIRLSDDRTGLNEVLQQTELNAEVVVRLLTLLAKCFTTNLYPSHRAIICGFLLDSDFFKTHLPRFLSGRGTANNLQSFEHLAVVFDYILSAMPTRTVDDLNDCICMCALSAERFEEKQPNAYRQFRMIRKTIEELQDARDKEGETKIQAVLATKHPPDDFRLIPIIPSMEELKTTEKTFLRENIIKGKFNDADHYLDVQFRLLREDFMAPLRSGIQDYLHGKKSNVMQKKIREIRLYETVRILPRPSFTDNGILRVLHFDTSRLHNVSWDNSKRLIYGSFLCLSDDGFETARFATVVDRDPRKLKRGNITVKFEDELYVEHQGTSDLNRVYVMAESSAFFEAYRHVLKGLQAFTVDNLPLQEYIVHVEKNLKLPTYLNEQSVFDLTCLVQASPLRDQEFLLRSIESHLDSWNPFGDPRLKSYQKKSNGLRLTSRMKAEIVGLDLSSWPSSDLLDLDDSQRKAMHLALTSSLALIQGPPGTGKTYVGLKIVQTLLANSDSWRESKDYCPILVVCLTNHALDQFLEGMIPFTRNLVRIGSRSKNEKLADFNLRQKRKNQNFVKLRQTRDKLSKIRERIEDEKKKLDFLRNRILHENALEFLQSDDQRLLESVREGHVEVFGEDEYENDSFLTSWLGLVFDFSVSEEDLEEFYYENLNESQIDQDPVAEQSTNFQDQLDFTLSEKTTENPAIERSEEDHDDNLIDVEDEWAARNNARQLDIDAALEEIPCHVNVCVNTNIWALQLASLKKPDLSEYDEIQSKMYDEMYKIRLRIAVRELIKSDVMSDKRLAEVENVWLINIADRWQLYRRWMKKMQEKTLQTIEQLHNKFGETVKELKEKEFARDMKIFRNNDIIGFTTTGAARYLTCLQELGPKIVIVEEAAEVLESHIITSLSQKTKHLILIGDHLQLRPSVTAYTLGKDFHMDISLFERMIENGIYYETLQLQHRMRPEISQLLVPHFYEHLEDHPIVRDYPSVTGMKSNVFFLNHSNPEKSTRDSTTHENHFEADFMVALCYYLLQQGYEPSQITILTAYAGQLFALKNRMERKKFEGVKVTVVDNYQGEENDIILLSFVRSNPENIIGFLKTANRVNVALSRAKKGLYCIGNFTLYANISEFWRGIVRDLDRNNLIGKELQLKCKTHGNITVVKNHADFNRFASNGGCEKICNERLPCGHICEIPCHPMEVPCNVSVRKKHANCEHVISLSCHVDVELLPCRILVDRVLKCGHEFKLQCHEDFNQFPCNVRVERTLPSCGHVINMLCHNNPEQEECKIPCEQQLSCGHECPRSCHPFDDSKHEMVKCMKQCEKTCTVGHRCKKFCFQDCENCMTDQIRKLECGHKVSCPCLNPIGDCSSSLGKDFLDSLLNNCEQPCKRILPCGHLCGQKCSETCGKCEMQVRKVLPCGHAMETKCSLPVEQVECMHRCEKKMICGHPCTNNCSKPCSNNCNQTVNRRGFCGHEVQVPCHVKSDYEQMKYCRQRCGKILPCMHECKGSCSDCFQGRVHVPCMERCERVLICGHRCNFLCGVICPPCFNDCSLKCIHGSCRKKCRNYCNNCDKPCEWKCEHYTCSRKCGDYCDRNRCNEPCKLLLKCGHPCIGLCGENCPKLCRICHFHRLEKMAGNKEVENARFVALSDCKHCIEVETLDNWMDSNVKEVGMKRCPVCKATIWHSYRYGNVIRRELEDIRKAKAKEQDKQFNIRKKIYILIRNIHIINQELNIPVFIPLEQLKTRLFGPVYKGLLIVMENQLNILKTMNSMMNRVRNELKSQVAKMIWLEEIASLGTRLMVNADIQNDWQLEAIDNELRRIALWAFYCDAREIVTNEMKLERYELTNIGSVIFAKNQPLSGNDQLMIIKTIKKVTGLSVVVNQKTNIIKTTDFVYENWHKCSTGDVFYKL